MLAAYRRAEYVVFRPRVVIRVGETNAELDALIGAAGRAAFLTAANPGSEPRGEEENRRRDKALREVLDEARRSYLEGQGGDPDGGWPAEPSLLVLGVGRDEAIELGRRFGQNAFVWCEPGKAPELAIVPRWRLVLDTQIWLDWLAFDDPSVAPLKKAVAEGWAEIYMDDACQAELARVLAYPIARKVPEQALRDQRLAEARRISRVPKRALTEAERTSLPRCRDRDDQKFLELSAAARADALVTKDRALLDLARRAAFRIVSPGELVLD